MLAASGIKKSISEISSAKVYFVRRRPHYSSHPYTVDAHPVSLYNTQSVILPLFMAACRDMTLLTIVVPISKKTLTKVVMARALLPFWRHRAVG